MYIPSSKRLGLMILASVLQNQGHQYLSIFSLTIHIYLEIATDEGRPD